MEVLGGRDINQIQTQYIEEESKRRKSLQARFSVMRDLVATPAVGQPGDSEGEGDNALEKAGAALSNGAPSKPDGTATTVVESTEVSTTISTTTVRIDLPTPPASGGSEASAVNGVAEKPKANGEDKHKLGHGCGEDDDDEKRDDEVSNYADAEEEAKPDDAEKKPDEDAKPLVESDTADAPPPVPLSPQEMPMTEEPDVEVVAYEQAGPVHLVFCDGCKAWVFTLFLAPIAYLLLFSFRALSMRDNPAVILGVDRRVLPLAMLDTNDANHAQMEQNGENIVGVRWKCLECLDYDLCDKCHSTGAHDEHEMLCIEHPDDYQGVELSVCPIYSCDAYGT